MLMLHARRPEYSEEQVANTDSAVDGFLLNTHKYLREQVVLADAKAALVFGASTTFLAFIVGRATAAGVLPFAQVKPATSLLAIGATALLAISALLAIAVVWPRLGGSASGDIYFRAITNSGSPAAYAEAVLREGAVSPARKVAEHNYELAVVCSAKFALLGHALALGAAGAFLGIVLLALI